MVTHLHKDAHKQSTVQYLRRGAVRKVWIRFEGDQVRVDCQSKFFVCHGTKLQRDHDITFAMALQDRDVLVAT